MHGHVHVHVHVHVVLVVRLYAFATRLVPFSTPRLMPSAAAMVILSDMTIIPAQQCSTKQTASKLATSGSSAAVGEMVARTTVDPTSPHGPQERRERREQTAFAVARNFYSYRVFYPRRM
jgi:hypothetical protein